MSLVKDLHPPSHNRFSHPTPHSLSLAPTSCWHRLIHLALHSFGLAPIQTLPSSCSSFIRFRTTCEQDISSLLWLRFSYSLGFQFHLFWFFQNDFVAQQCKVPIICKKVQPYFMTCLEFGKPVILAQKATKIKPKIDTTHTTHVFN